MQQIGDLDQNTVVWRYLPFKRFAQLIQFRALWFSRLKAFVDDLDEGKMPTLPRSQLREQHRSMEDWFSNEDQKRQLWRWVDENEVYGRDLIVATCWYIEDHESREMWALYGRDHEAVAIKSTVGELAGSLVKILPKKWWMGKVRYVDLKTYDGMNAYQASQAFQRAFVKGTKYFHENELRVATMNYVAPGCLNPDGSPQTDRQRAGFIDASNGPGIYVTADLSMMIKEVRTAPGASDSHHEAVKSLIHGAGHDIPVMQSACV